MKKYIMANWKMNKNFSDIPDYIEDLKSNAGDLENVVVCVPSVMLKDFSDKSAGKFGVGAQNCHFADHGAFTGEVSTEMVKSAGATYVLVGHSERRHIFGENDELLNKKLISVLNSGLKAVFCVGETLEELDSYKEVIGKQLLVGLENCPDFSNVIIAYEPVWAIGTGKVATVDDIVRVHTFIKELVKEKFGVDLPILYGGSVKASNSKEILALSEVDGVLVGGAGLNSLEFCDIIKSR